MRSPIVPTHYSGLKPHTFVPSVGLIRVAAAATAPTEFSSAVMSPSAHHMRSAATHSRWGTPHTTFSSLTRLARAHRLPAALRASEQRLLGGHTAAAASPLQANNSTTRVCFTSQPTKMPADTAPAAAAASSRPPASWRRPYSPGPLTEAEFEAYWEDGFVIKRGLLSQEDIDPCLAAIER